MKRSQSILNSEIKENKQEDNKEDNKEDKQEDNKVDKQDIELDKNTNIGILNKETDEDIEFYDNNYFNFLYDVNSFNIDDVINS